MWEDEELRVNRSDTFPLPSQTSVQLIIKRVGLRTRRVEEKDTDYLVNGTQAVPDMVLGST